MQAIERHLYSRKGRLYYRSGLPKTLKSFLPFKEIVLSLGTTELAIARLYVAKLDLEVERLTNDLISILEQSPDEQGLNKLADRVTGCNDKLRDAVGLNNIRHSPHWYSSLQSLSKERGRCHSKLFSQVFTDYIDDCLSNSKRTKAHKNYVFDLFLQLVGDLPISEIKRGDARRFKKILLRMPANMSKHAGVDMSNLDFDNLPKGALQSHHTVNNKLVSLLSFFEWAIENELYEGLNPFKGLLIKDVKANKKKVYSRDDLNILFSCPIYTGCGGLGKLSKRLEEGSTIYKDYLYWVPLIGLYSGMRLNEICQLHKSDIKEERGIWFMDVNDDGDKKLKTTSSKRKVPIHCKLIESGILEFVHNKGGRIFDELEIGRDGSHSYMFTKIYARLLKRLDLKQEGLCFHSFRHTFIDKLRNSGVERAISMALVGHGGKSDIHSNYGYGYTLSTLKEGINKVIFDLPKMP